MELIIPAFIAGLLTFLAPCTFPLVPGYLGFISGVSANDLQDPSKQQYAKRKVFLNGLMYVLGFSLIFMLLGSAFGAAGSFLGQHRIWLSRVGGIFVIFFGLYLMHVFDLKALSFLNREKRFRLTNKLHPGKPSSSFIFGMTFAFGWTPCVGPVLGSILVLASTSGTILEGTFLLAMFSLGLATPFLLLALAVGHAAAYVKKISRYLHIISVIGGIFLVFLGVLLLTDNLVIWIGKFYEWFDFFNIEERFYRYL